MILEYDAYDYLSKDVSLVLSFCAISALLRVAEKMFV